MKIKSSYFPMIIFDIILFLVGSFYLLFDFKYKYIDMIDVNKMYAKICDEEEYLDKSYCVEYKNNGKVQGTFDGYIIFYYLVNDSVISYLNISLALIMPIILLKNICKTLNNGELKYILVRQDYKKFKLNLLKQAFIYSILIIVPFIFLILECFALATTKFDIGLFDPSLANFPIEYLKMGGYFFVVYLINIFTMTFIFSELSLISLRIVNNYYISIIISYLVYLVLEIISYLFFGVFIGSNILKLDISSYFEMMNFMNFANVPNFSLYIIIRLTILGILLLVFWLIFKNKEKFMMYIEKGSEKQK